LSLPESGPNAPIRVDLHAVKGATNQTERTSKSQSLARHEPPMLA
jgi:hypothetical protein